MAKKLCAFRFEPEVVVLLKDIALREGKSQAEIVTRSIGLYHASMLYANKDSEKKTKQSYTEKTRDCDLIE